MKTREQLASLKPHQPCLEATSFHALGNLKTYLDVRDVVVSNLQSKRVWTPNATYAGSTARKTQMPWTLAKLEIRVVKVKRVIRERSTKAKA